MKRIIIGAFMLFTAYQSALADIVGGGINYLRYRNAGVAQPDTTQQDPAYYQKYANQVSSQYGAGSNAASQYTAGY